MNIKCVPKHDMHAILKACDDSPYGGHHARDRTGAKVLQLGFYWPTLINICLEVCQKL
jgi:hypothetical protein